MRRLPYSTALAAAASASGAGAARCERVRQYSTWGGACKEGLLLRLLQGLIPVKPHAERKGKGGLAVNHCKLLPKETAEPAC